MEERAPGEEKRVYEEQTEVTFNLPSMRCSDIPLARGLRHLLEMCSYKGRSKAVTVKGG